LPSASPASIPVPTEGKLGELATALQAKFGPIAQIQEQTTVGPIISSELTQQAILLVILGSIGILLWVTIRFADVKFGVSAIAALLHDVIVVVGIFAILGTLFGVQVDSLFVTAMLTIIGFSVHDTIVVFDRIRENRARHAGEPFDAIVNHSILQTLGRSINTSMTVVITLLALLLIGASSIREFVLALLIGIISGTYSSIFNASMILVVWHHWEDRRRQQAVAQARPVR
jgi:preprotein translocase subunit SecF